jgi:hypothetical protein
VKQPSTGRTVSWRLAPGLALLGRQLDKLNITWYSIGNSEHLKRHGGHTPWKPEAPFGVVTAIDVMASAHADVERRILKLMKSDFDTSWIDFINVNGSQYDWDGRRQGSSGDQHLHLEVLGNRTSFTSNLFLEMWAPPKPASKPPAKTPPAKPSETGEVTMRVIQKRGDDKRWKTDGFGREHIKTMEDVADLEAAFGKTVPVNNLNAFGPEVATVATPEKK